MKAFLLSCLAAGCILGEQAGPLAAREGSLVRLPIDNWVVDYAEESCALRRTFGSQEEPVYLEIRQFAPSAHYQFTVATSATERMEEAPQVRFVPDAQDREPANVRFADFGVAKGVIFNDTLHLSELKYAMDELPAGDERDNLRLWEDSDRDMREREITGISLRESFARDMVLETGELHQPMQALRSCMNDLLAHWGVDPSVHNSLTRPAQPRNQLRLAQRVLRNLPASSIQSRVNEWLHVRLNIDPDGTVSDCRLQVPTSHPDLHQAVCREMLRAPFDPALDASGDPIRSFWTTVIAVTSD